MSKNTRPFLLSQTGSTRATAYGFSNKSITLDDRLCVVWLDAIAQVRGRVYDRTTGEWSETFTLFEGCDNHTSPALTADRNRHLRMAYGPHGTWGGWNCGCFKWTVSEHPGRVESWKREESFGYNSTYASLIHTPEDLDAIVYRGGESPASLMFQKQRAIGGWTTAKSLLCQEIEPQYTQYGGIITCDSRGILYAACHFYNVGGGDNPAVRGDKSRMRSCGAAILKSSDMGETWTDLSDAIFETPGVYEERIAIPPAHDYVYIKGLSVDSRNTVWTLTLKPAVDDQRILLSHWVNERWDIVDLQPCLPGDRVAVDAVLTIDTQDRLHLAVTAVRKGKKGDVAAWGAASCEVFHLVTTGTVENSECNMVSIPDDTTASWLPNISLAGPFHPVDKPVILYTHGVHGEGCSPTTETEVYCVMLGEQE